MFLDFIPTAEYNTLITEQNITQMNGDFFMSIKHDFPFDPTCGYTRERLLAVKGTAPTDEFIAFWRKTYDLTMNAELDYQPEGEVWSPDENVKIYRVRFRNWDDVEIVTWIARPAHSTGGLLIGQGYGNMATPPTGTDPGLTIVLPNIRGLGFSQHKDIPWEPGKHAGYGIESKETYVIRGCVSDLWMAARVMIDMFPDTADALYYQGGSLGGGMGALAVAFDPRIKAAYLNVPTLGGKIQFEFPASEGDPAYTRQYHALNVPGGMELFSYFDASAAAHLIKVPTLVTPALFDPSVPPPAQFAVANSIPEEYRIMRIRDVGHFAATDRDKELEKELEKIREKIFSPA